MAFQILVGVVMWVLSIIVCDGLGLIFNGPGQPGWGTGVGILALFIATQLFAALMFRFHISLQVFWGLGLSAFFVLVWLYLGPFWEELSSDNVSFEITWHTDLALVLLVAVTQWFSFFAFRRRIVMQVSKGIVRCVLLAIPLLGCEIVFFEKHLPDGSIQVGWRAGVLFLLLLAVTQVISFSTFRWIRRNDRRPPTGIVAGGAPLTKP
jgi:hypothetical protein